MNLIVMASGPLFIFYSRLLFKTMFKIYSFLQELKTLTFYIQHIGYKIVSLNKILFFMQKRFIKFAVVSMFIS